VSERQRLRRFLGAAWLLTGATAALMEACRDAAVLSPADSSIAKPIGASPAPSFVPQIAFVSTRDGSPYIYLASANGDVVRFAKGENPAWIFNGTQIAFNGVAADGKGQELHVMRVDGAWESLLPVSGSEPDWSPDGTSLLFAASGGIYSGATGPLFAGSGGTGSPMGAGFGSTLLVPNDFVEPGDQLHRPRWSPDGRHIAFVRVSATQARDIYVANADGSNPQRLVAGDGPRWSPDGSTISFDLPQGVVATVNLDGSNLRTRGAEGSSSQVNNGDWSPDGRSLVFSQLAAPSATRVFILDIDSGALTQLIPDAGHAASANYVDFEAVWLRPKSPWDY